VFERHSALTEQLAAGARDGADGRRTLCISEVRGWNLAQLAVFAGHDAEFQSALRPLIEADLPAQVGVPLESNSDHRVYRTAQNQFWALSSDSAWLTQLACAVRPEAGSATFLSHSRVRIAIEGAPVREVLAKGIAIDLHPAAFPVGRFAQTGLHHTGILLERRGADRFELMVLRTFAASIWAWLVDAALPFGYELRVEQPRSS
jgi:sarcosine oxidase subunit gamma